MWLQLQILPCFPSNTIRRMSGTTKFLKLHRIAKNLPVCSHALEIAVENIGLKRGRGPGRGAAQSGFVADAAAQPAEKRSRRASVSEAAIPVSANTFDGASALDTVTPQALCESRLCKETVELLGSSSGGVTHLPAAQAHVFDALYDGEDLVVHSRFSDSNSLGVVLPIVERLKVAAKDAAATIRYGRKPRVIVLAPTGAVASRIYNDFKQLHGTGLSSLAAHAQGSLQQLMRAAFARRAGAKATSSMEVQQRALVCGVDIVVGTPGRLKALMEGGFLQLGAVQVAVVVAMDSMLELGSAECMQNILDGIPALKAFKSAAAAAAAVGARAAGAGTPKKAVQTVLFSESASPWTTLMERAYTRSHRASAVPAVQPLPVTVTVGASSHICWRLLVLCEPSPPRPALDFSFVHLPVSSAPSVSIPPSSASRICRTHPPQDWLQLASLCLQQLPGH